MNRRSLHPTPAELEALADGTLPAPKRARLASHVEACEACAVELAEQRQLFAALADLPLLSPRAGFADRVMAHVEVASPAAAPVRAPLGERLRALVPGRRLRWTLAAAFSALPVVTLGTLAVWLATSTTVSFQALWIFAMQGIAAGLSSAGTWALETLAATRLAGWVGAFGRSLVAIGPGQLGIAAFMLGLLTLASAWVLYSNLIRTPTRERSHVSYSF